MLWDKDIILEEELPDDCTKDLCHTNFEDPTGLLGLLRCNKNSSDKEIKQVRIAEKRVYMAGSISHNLDRSKYPFNAELKIGRALVQR